MTDQPQLSAMVTRRFSAPPEPVFDAWLDPAMIGRWMIGAVVRDEEVVHIKMDARIGGTFSFMVRRQGVEIDHVGEYLAIDRPHRLVFTWGIAGEAEGRSVTVAIVPLETGSEVTLTHDLHPDWADYKERTEEAWAKMLGALAAVLG